MKVVLGMGAVTAMALAASGADASKAVASVMQKLKTDAQRKSFTELIECMDDFKAKLEGEHAAATATYEEFTKYCHDEARNKGFAIDTSSRRIFF